MGQKKSARLAECAKSLLIDRLAANRVKLSTTDLLLFYLSICIVLSIYKLTESVLFFGIFQYTLHILFILSVMVFKWQKKNCYKFNTPGLWGHIIHTIPKQKVFFSIPLRTMKVLLSDFIQNMSQAPSKFWSIWIETDKWDDLKKLLVEFKKNLFVLSSYESLKVYNPQSIYIL